MTAPRAKRDAAAQPTDHRKAAEDALDAAEGYPAHSPERSLLAAQVHALLAIEQRLTELLDQRQQSPNAKRAAGTRPSLRAARAAG